MLIRLITAIAAFTLGTSAPAQATETLDAMVKAAMTGAHVPAVGAIIVRNGKITEQVARGVRRNDGRAAVGADDVWLIGSTGKVMTVAMIARLVEQGKLAWDTPLDKMLPGVAMRPEYRKATLVQLLSHRSGLPRDIRNAALLDKFFSDRRSTTEQRAAYVEQALMDAPEVTDGSGFSYSNSGFLVATAIAEKVTGKRYEALMQDEVFAPLGMEHVGFGNTGDGQNRGHQRGKPMLKMTKGDDGAPTMYAPAGFLHMPLVAWARFNLDQLAGAKGRGTLLTPASYKLMQTAQPGSPAGLDWGVQGSIAGRQGPALVHQGSDGNWLAIVALFPERGNGAMVVANAADGMGADKVLQSVFVKLFPTLSPSTAKP